MPGWRRSWLGAWFHASAGWFGTIHAIVPLAILVATCTLVVKVIATAKELLVALRLGTNPELDAFLFAYMFPAFLISIAAASMQSASVPRFMRVKTESSPEAANQFAARSASVCAVVLILMVVVIAPICSVAIPFLARGFDEPTVATAQRLVYMLMPLLFLNGMTKYWSGLLNAETRYSIPALVPAATPMLVACALWVGWSKLGIYSLAVGTLAGGMLEFLIVAASMRRIGMPLFRMIKTIDSDQRAMIQQFWPAAIASILMSGTVLIDQTMAAGLVEGSVSALSYGTKLSVVVAAVIVMAISTVTLPYFSNLVSQSDWRAIRRSLVPGGAAVAAISILVTTIIVTQSEQIVEVVFERGAFTASDTELVARIQAWHALQIPFYALSMIMVRLVTALAATRLLMIGAALNLAADLTLNLTLVPINGVVGIAMANAGMYLVSCAFLWVAALRRLQVVELRV